MPPKNTLLGFTTAAPVSTDVHSNINDLMVQFDKTQLWQKALNEVEKSMSGYKHPEPITGTAPDIALSPLVAAKSIPNLLKMVKKINLKNPIYHHTSIPKAKEILETQKIVGMHQPDKFLKDVHKPIRAFSVTRDPKFLSRPHTNIGTDVRFIMDRDELIRKGYKMKPFAEAGFRKTKKIEGNWKFPNVKKIFYKGEPKTAEWLEKRKIELIRQGKSNWERELKKTGLKLEYHVNRMNPRFEFEERVLGNLPTSDIKLIDWAKIPIAHGTELAQGVHMKSKYLYGGARVPTEELKHLMESIMNVNQKSPQLPLMMSEQVRSTLKQVQPYLTNIYTEYGLPDKVKALEKLMSAPTYKYNPFKLIKEPKKIPVPTWDKVLKKAVTKYIDNPKYQLNK